MGQRGHGASRGLKCFPWKRKRKSSIGNRTFVHQRKLLPVKGVELVSDRVTYKVLRGCRGNIIVLNVHGQREDKSDYS